ncbi:MAG: hypothetical protein KJ927_17465, partial [Candidatus Eisenbacteria bacterium]|nr:hypothetical protein [Candidatus Eisenbacteria bacterium]
MIKWHSLAIIIAVSLVALSIPEGPSGNETMVTTPSLAETVREALRRRIESAGVPPHIEIGEERIY